MTLDIAMSSTYIDVSCWLLLSVSLDLSVWIPGPVCEGSKVEINCNTSCASKDKHTVMWRKNGVDVSGEQRKNDKLIFNHVSIEDEGSYSCALKDFQEHPSLPVKLNVMCKCIIKKVL